MTLQKPWAFVLTLMLCSTAFPGGVAAVDPVQVLRQDPAVRSVEAVAARNFGPMVRVRLREVQDELYVLFSNEATTPVEAGQVRQLALWLNVPAGHRLSASGANSLMGLASNLGALCLSQPATSVAEVLQRHVNRRLPAPNLLHRSVSGVSLEIVPHLPWVSSGRSVKVTLVQPADAPSPRCVLPIVVPN